jgi:HlyD family secretion protein
MKRLRAIIILVLIVLAVRYYAMRPAAAELVLTGIVTTQDVIVSPQVGGRLQTLVVNEGDVVAPGQLIGTIEAGEFQADSAYYAHNVAGMASQVAEGEAAVRYQERQTEDQIQQAEAVLAATAAQQNEVGVMLQDAKISFDRVQALNKEGVASAQQLDRARTAYDAARARIDTLNKQIDAQRAAVAVARANLEQIGIRQGELSASRHQREAAAAQKTKADLRLGYTELRAPIGGIVDVRAARAGEVVSAGQPVITLINSDDLWVRADVEETFIDRVRIGDRLQVRLPSGEERTGTVFYRAADAGFATQRDVSRIKRDIKTFEVRLRVDNNDRRLVTGMTAYVILPTVGGN